MNDDDYLEIQIIVDEMIYEYIEENVLLMSKPYFHEMLIEDITSDYLNLMGDIPCLRDEENYDNIVWFIAYICDEYFYVYGIPKRSYICTEYEDKTFEEYEIISKQIEFLSNVKQPQQKTQEWYEFRQGLFTASSIWKIFGSDAQVNSIIYEKCQPYNSNHYFRSNSMDWGNFYEPISVKVYEHLYHTTIRDFGCIQHRHYNFIGASPDGINVSRDSNKFGRLIEIKNIVNREITDQPKEDYWIQMQIQMETCDLDECDFIETRFKEFTDRNEFDAFILTDDQFCKGVTLSFVRRDCADSHQNVDKKYETFIVYNDYEDDLRENIYDWISLQKEQFKDEYIPFSVRYWYLDEFSCLLVKRNRRWFQTAIDNIKLTWDIIQQEKKTGYEHRNNKKKISVTQLANSDTQIIKNMPNNNNNICLIKLDTNGNII